MESPARSDLPDWAQDIVSPLDERMGIELLELSAERAVGRCPVAGNTQPLGLWHGGATCVVAETLGSLAAWAYARPRDLVGYGVDINATHHASVSAGHVTGTATALHLGRTTATYEVVLTDDDDRRIATARITCALRPAVG